MIPGGHGTSERRCHCGARFEGADHCGYCGCEQYERYCDASYHAHLPATESWLPGDRSRSYIR